MNRDRLTLCHAETHEQRKKLYNEIPGREHRAHRIFPFQAAGEENEQEFMVYGSVTYNHHDGNTKDQEWAARGVVVKGRGDEVELKFYHVFIVSLADLEAWLR